MTDSGMQSPGKVNFYDLSYAEVENSIVELGHQPFRVKQIWEWVYQKYVANFDEMTNLPLSMRVQLDNMFTLGAFTIVSSQRSSDNQTTKVLFRLLDGQLIETVLMKYKKRRTLCISTQVGCAMGCVFCATGQMGFYRNLSTGDIIAQVLYFANQLSQVEQRVTNVVLMGMGEPLHNYDNTLSAIDRLTDSNGFNLGARKITISTVGLVPAIIRYADEQRQTRLAISLHAATDAERNRLIPVSKKWPLSELMDACRYYIDRTGRRLTFEWALIHEENDTREQAAALGQLLRGMLCHVNLIPLNPTSGYEGGPSMRDRVEEFQEELARFGVSSTVRVRRGIDIQAGCGQLRDRYDRDMETNDLPL